MNLDAGDNSQKYITCFASHSKHGTISCTALTDVYCVKENYNCPFWKDRLTFINEKNHNKNDID